MKNKVKYFGKRYFITAMNGMALGLFGSLILGTILSTIAKIPLFHFLTSISTVLGAGQLVYGAAIGAGVALALKHKPLVVIGSIAAGAVAISEGGGPFGAFIAGIFAAEVAGLVAGKTKVDIIITPLVGILSGGIIAILVGPPIKTMMDWIAEGINSMTTAQPLVMGIVIAVVIGMALTAPISSAAICMGIGIDGIAAGAAVVGCAVQMVGFAICSIKKNGLGGFFSVGLGTSMLQFGNIMRKPIIWLPTIIVSAILGPISTTVLKMVNTSTGAGMGTCGLVGQFGAIEAMTKRGDQMWTIIWQIGLMHFILPIILVYAINELFIHLKWITPEDYLLNRTENVEHPVLVTEKTIAV